MSKIVKMKTSVIITSKNEPNLIGRTIKSFQNQTQPTEIICSIPDKETIKEARKYKVRIISTGEICDEIFRTKFTAHRWLKKFAKDLYMNPSELEVVTMDELS